MRVNSNGPWSTLDHGDIAVPALALDEFVTRNVAFVKIDVEGWEPHVLAGARALMATCRPLVLMEWNSWSLMLAHHDPITSSLAIWKAFDVTEMFYQDKPQGAPQSELEIVQKNVTAHGSVSDILMRSRADIPVPSLEDMISSPAHLRLLQERAAAT